MYVSQWRSLAAACSLWKSVFLLQVTRESVSILQVMCAASECAMNMKVCMVKYHHGTKLYRKKYHSFVAYSYQLHHSEVVLTFNRNVANVVCFLPSLRAPVLKLSTPLFLMSQQHKARLVLAHCIAAVCVQCGLERVPTECLSNVCT